MRSLRTLIVEDSEPDTELLVHHLHSGGYDIIHRRVETEAQMRAALAEESWEIIFSDFSMPGFSALRALAVLNSTSLDIPFIIVSGTIGEETAVQALKNGAHDFFLKGRLTHLLAAVENELRHVGARVALREATRARDEFLSIASHELRTPTTTLVLQVASALKLVQSRLHTEISMETVEIKLISAARQVDRLMALIEALLNFSRVAAGRLTITPAAMDLGELVQRVVGHLDGILKHARCEVVLTGESGLSGWWDPIWLEVVVSNLLTNAAKFGQGKTIEVALDIQGDLARLVVTDHGMGIATEDQKRVFDRFERAASAQNFGGFGIGLWVTKQVIAAHGGSIEVSSELGAGSTFTVLLPRAVGFPSSGQRGGLLDDEVRDVVHHRVDQAAGRAFEGALVGSQGDLPLALGTGQKVQ
jgi:signal transduction histidine kinase